MKIGVAIAVMNRTDRVFPCVQSWLASPLVDTITLVDWSSEQEVYLEPSLNGLLTHPKIRMINVVGETSFIGIAHSYNLAVKYTDADLIVKADIDHVLKLDKFILECREACRTGYLRGDADSYMGLCAFTKNDFNIVGRYDERLKGWGYDDNSLYARLIKRGRQAYYYQAAKQYVYHIPHSDHMRTANYPIRNILLSQLRNIIVSSQNSISKESEYDIIRSQDNYLQVKRIV